MKSCIVCEKKIDDNKAIAKHEVYFCSEKCLKEYEEKLEKLKQVVDWDNCC